MSVKANSVQGHTFTVSSRYDMSASKILGRGSFGIVATALDCTSGKVVAIKRIRYTARLSERTR